MRRCKFQGDGKVIDGRISCEDPAENKVDQWQMTWQSGRDPDEMVMP